MDNIKETKVEEPKVATPEVISEVEKPQAATNKKGLLNQLLRTVLGRQVAS